MTENERLIKTMEEDLKQTMLRIQMDKDDLKKAIERVELLKQKIAELSLIDDPIQKYPKYEFKTTNTTLQAFCVQCGFNNTDNFHIEELEDYNVRIIDTLGKSLNVLQMMDLIMIQDEEDHSTRLMTRNSIGDFVEYH